MTLFKIGTGSRIPPAEGLFRISFWGHISAQIDIFTKFGEYVGNEFPQGVDGLNTFPSRIQFGAAMWHTYNIPAVNFTVVN